LLYACSVSQTGRVVGSHVLMAAACRSRVFARLISALSVCDAIRPAPTRKGLDAVSPDVPIVVVGSRRGLGALNSAAFKLAGISKENSTFEGVKVRTDESGELIGNPPSYPQAILLMDKLLPAWTPKAQEEMIEQGMRERNALGITSIRELQAWPEAVASYYRLWRQDKLTLRVALGIEFPDQANTEKYLELLGVGVPFGGSLDADGLCRRRALDARHDGRETMDGPDTGDEPLGLAAGAPCVL
jgi:predicted amidohydrolase YtcJ